MAGPRTKRRSRPVAHYVAMVSCVCVLLPLASLVWIAAGGDGSDWPHLSRNVLPGAGATTLALMVMVAAGTAVIGVAAAWLIVAFDFPLRRTLSWAIVLPLAVPPYLAAYALAEFFGFTGPVQGLLRDAFGFATARDYWFPDIRSTAGAALVLGCVLYPYVYLTTRIVFLLQGRTIADAARTLGANPGKVFWRVLLPVARPAIVAGVALVLMETINDVGAAEYLGVRTLTTSIYTVWLSRGSLAGAAQIALIMLALVFLLIVAEQAARRRRRFHSSRTTEVSARPLRRRLRGLAAVAALLTLLPPIVLGFGVPLYVFGRYALRRLEQFGSPDLAEAFVNSVATASCAAAITVVLALVLIDATRLARSRTTGLAVRLASVGYALPGGILGLGLLVTLARFDNALDAIARDAFGVSTGLLMTGSAAAVVAACVIRFLALAEGAIRSGLEKLPPNLDEAARNLGQSPRGSAAKVLLPLLRPAIFTAATMVFVDTVKELSATILLRPFGFGTLATHVYENASRGAPQDGAVAAMLIMLTALAPILLLSGALARDGDN